MATVLARRLVLFSLMAFFLLAGCTAEAVPLSARPPTLVSIRPVAKIGLLAPFEGLHRREGYAALALLRGALAAQPSPGDYLPVALDTHADPAMTLRALEKLLIDPVVGVIVGPLDPALAGALPAAFGEDDPLPWIPPYAVAPSGGFADPRLSSAWADELIRAVGEAAMAQGAQRLVIAGWSAGWPHRDQSGWQQVAGLPIFLNEDPAQVERTDAVLWLGLPEDGVHYLSVLRSRFAGLPFWVTYAGASPILPERAANLENVYWATWRNLEYTEAVVDGSPLTPDQHRVQLAMQTAIDALSGLDALSAMAEQSSLGWEIVLYAFDDEGHPHLYVTE